MDKLVAIGIIIIDTFLAALGLIFFRLGAMSLVKKKIKNISYILKVLFSKYILLGMLFYALGTLLYIWVLSFQDLSYLYPLTAIMYYFVIFFSIKILKEKMNKYKWLGVLLITIGVIIISI